jgi:hypothetical protein
VTTRLSTHVFQSDGITDPVALKPVEYCELCKLPKGHERHELPVTPAEVVEAEARRWPDQTELEN